MKLEIKPCTVREAKRLVLRWHRHLPRVHAGLFAAALAIDGVLVGVAMVALPPARWNGTGRVIISRVAVAEDVRNGCSKLYGALCRAADNLGWTEAWTYTLPGESGDSLRAAGFEYMGETRGEEHDRKARPRAAVVDASPKGRWRRVLGHGRASGGPPPT